MKGKKILQYLNSKGTVKFCDITGMDDNAIQKLKDSFKSEHYNIIDHSIVKTHTFYGSYFLEVDASGFIYLVSKNEGKTKVKGEYVNNLLSIFDKYKVNIKRIMSGLIKEHGQLQLSASKRKRLVWMNLFKKLGYTVELDKDVYMNNVVIIKN